MLLNIRPLAPEQLLYPCQASSRSPTSREVRCRTTCLARIRFSRNSGTRVISRIATRGGAETMYPEFQETLKEAPARAPAK